MSSLLKGTRVTANVGGKEIILETGRVARQAGGAVWIQCGGTVALVTVCEQPLETPKDFFPLTVEYSEKMYAAGRIPGNFFRREIGRPSDNETLVARLIDRPIRPLFPKGYGNEVQVLASVISADADNLPDVLCITGASAAVCLSSTPFAGPVAGARLGRVDGQFVINPTRQELERSELNIVFAASRDAVVMVEGEAQFAPETLIIEALEWGHKAIQPLLDAQEELVRLAGKVKNPFTPKEDDPEIYAHVEKLALEAGMEEALRIPDKLERKDARKAVKVKVKEMLAADPAWAENEEAQREVGAILEHLEKKLVRRRILKEGTRIDNRDTKTVRPIEIETGVLPRAHGSVLFARGETKALVVTTLGSSTDEQRVDSLVGDDSKRFMLHYNFPLLGGRSKAAACFPPRNRARRSGGTRPEGHFAFGGKLPLYRARGVRNSGIQRFVVYGCRVRRLLVPDGCGRAHFGPCGRGGYGVDQGRRSVSRVDRYPG